MIRALMAIGLGLGVGVGTASALAAQGKEPTDTDEPRLVAADFGYAAYIGVGDEDGALTFPISFGAERLLCGQIKVGVRLDVRPAVFDDLGAPGQARLPSGDTWSLTVNLDGVF